VKLVDHVPLMRGAMTPDSETVCSNRPGCQLLVSDLLRRVSDTNNLRLPKTRSFCSQLISKMRRRSLQVQ